MTTQANLEHMPTSTDGVNATSRRKVFRPWSKAIIAANREIGKPKQEKAQHGPDRAFDNQITVAAPRAAEAKPDSCNDSTELRNGDEDCDRVLPDTRG